MQNNIFERLAHPLLRALAVSLLGFSFIVLQACSSNSDKEQAERGSEQEVYERAQRYLKASNWETAIQSLQLLEESFPFGSYAEHAQLELIYAYFRSDQFEAAVASSERFIRLHPQHRNVDYAFYMRGIASFYNESAFSSMFSMDVTQRDPGTAKDAFSYFSQLLAQYPESEYTLDAKKRMIFLRNSLARGEINVANYYFKRGAYLAAGNRGRWVVENMQETPAVPDALAVMAQAYHLLGMQELSDDAVNILTHNFPNHPAMQSGTFNYQYGRDQKRSWISLVTFGLFDKHPFIEFDSRKQYNTLYFDEDSPPLIAPPVS